LYKLASVDRPLSTTAMRLHLNVDNVTTLSKDRWYPERGRCYTSRENQLAVSGDTEMVACRDTSSSLAPECGASPNMVEQEAHNQQEQSPLKRVPSIHPSRKLVRDNCLYAIDNSIDNQ